MLLAGLLAGCSSTPATHGVVLPDNVRASMDRHVLVTVQNNTTYLTPHPGSSPRGYDVSRRYAVSPAARKIVRDLEHDYGLHEVAGWPIDILAVHCVAFRLPESAPLSSVLDELRRDPRVESVQPLQRFSTQSTSYNDPYVELQGGVRAMQVLEAQRWASGAGVTVAVIDTGIDLAHPDLEGRVEKAYDFVNPGREGFNADRHGTAVAGAIAAVANNGRGIVGVAPGIKLVALKACWQTSADRAECDSFTLAQALAVAIRQHAQVINMSLAGPSDALLERLIASALAHNIIIVGAVSQQNGADAFPAGVVGVIGVQVAERAAPSGDTLAAPGVDVLSLTPQGHYDFVSGSSMSAALVTGTIALLLERHRKLTPEKVRELLSATSATVQLASGRSSTASVNACRALAALSDGAACTSDEQLAGTKHDPVARASSPTLR